MENSRNSSQLPERMGYVHKFPSNWPNYTFNIFHQPRFPWNKGISLTKPPFVVRSGEVAIIWPDPRVARWKTLKETNRASNRLWPSSAPAPVKQNTTLLSMTLWPFWPPNLLLHQWEKEGLDLWSSGFNRKRRVWIQSAWSKMARWVAPALRHPL